MEYEYDEEKSLRNYVDRGIDFDFAARIFDSTYIEIEDRRADYDERRYIVIGPVDGMLFVVVYTWRNGRRRIISARRASKRERNVYRRTIT
ncbi:MAG: BrnT family toxin [Rhodospirillales bacterium]|nr:MAG: BrnT family toxin [Rhodospirillales bacterium]